MKKTERYKQRIEDPRHNRKMWLDPRYLEKNVPKDFMGPKKFFFIDKCKVFNRIAEHWTKGEDFSAILNVGISSIAADFHYQYKRLLRHATGLGCFHEVLKELTEKGLNTLFSSITLAIKQTYVSLDVDFLNNALPKINQGSAVAVFLYMKSRCSMPNGQNGVTGLTDTTIGKFLGISTKSVQRSRLILEENNLIEKISSAIIPNEAGKLFTYRKYKINI